MLEKIGKEMESYFSSEEFRVGLRKFCHQAGHAIGKFLVLALNDELERQREKRKYDGHNEFLRYQDIAKSRNEQFQSGGLFDN